jgi:glycosyltransferase A (GT-A) superfamily protein (DUF2064 family)
MTAMPTSLLVMASAPEPGKVNTRLTPPATPEQAAEIAAASLLDTLAAASGLTTLVALSGELTGALQRAEVAEALARTTVFAQCDGDLDVRLAAAHAQAKRIAPHRPVLQIGMDTPQVTDDLLGECAAALHRVDELDAVLGPASDGGWWALGFRDPADARVLRGVPMSRPDSGERTLAALCAGGLRVLVLPELSDVDTMEDAEKVAADIPSSRFAAEVRAVCGEPWSSTDASP